jgi:outer membrane receptor protein involved in Fe transport
MKAQSLDVSGFVIDATDEPVAFANLLVLKVKDSSVVTGTSSDENGFFKISKLNPDQYLLKTTFIGFTDNFKVITVSEEMVDIEILMEESLEALNEVQLIYKKPTVVRESDRLVFKVENTALSQGNLVEVLRSTPSVLVLDDAILVKNTTPVIYINDRRVHLSSSEIIELLQGTSAANIKSVEVITNPSAKYDADSGVVLKIIMSKNLVTGYNGSVFSNYEQGVFPKTSFGTTHYFKGDKTNLFFNYSFNSRKDNRVDDEQVFYPDEEWNTNLNKNKWSETHNLGVNFDYELSEKSNLALSANAQFLPYFKYLIRSNTDIESNASSFDRITSNSLSRDNRHNVGFDLDYNYQISDASKLSFNAHYTNYDYQRRQDVNSDYSIDGAIIVEETAYNSKSNQDTNIFTSQLDYAMTLSENASLGTGIKFSNVKTGSGILQNDIIGGLEIINPGNTNTFDYNENVYGAYLDYSYSKDKLNLNAGLRVEQTNITGISSNDSNSKQDYLEFFPTVSLGWQISENVLSSINFKRSIDRPNYNNLNPFVYYLNDNTIFTGNPNLKPVITNAIFLDASINDKFSFTVYYKKYENNFFELPLQDNANNILIYTPLNISSTEEIGFDFETNLNITDRWFLYFATSIYNYKDTGTVSGTSLKRDMWSNYSNLTSNISFLKDKSLTASLSIYYLGKNIQGFRIIDTRWDTYFTISKRLFKDKGSISLSMSDLFNKQDYSSSLDFLNQRSNILNDFDTRYIKLGFRYKFGNTKLSTNERYSEEDVRLQKNN